MVIAIDRPFRTILSIRWTVITFIFFMLKETTIESTTAIDEISEATITDTESKLNYNFTRLIF